MSGKTTVIDGELYVYVREIELTRLRWDAEEYRRMRAAQMRHSLQAVDHLGWQELGRNGKPVEAIKMIRALLGSSLKEAKDVYDTWRATGKVELP